MPLSQMPDPVSSPAACVREPPSSGHWPFRPGLLLLDEPFSALDYQTRLTVSDDIYRILRSQQMSAVLVTHDISEAISFCDRIIVLTSRPASVKKTFDIHLTLDGDRTPFKARMAPEFKDYFNEIWGELNV